jgi:hypothetical protein
MIELYVKKSSIDNIGDFLNNLPRTSNRTENTIFFIINLAHQIHEPDPQRPLYLTLVGPNAIDGWDQNDFDKGDDDRNEDNDVLKEEEQNHDHNENRIFNSKE